MLKIVHSDLQKALDFATQKHRGQVRQGGKPFISHPQAVAAYLQERGYNQDTLITALFHDLLEDTDATEAELLALSNPKVLDAVILLTKPIPYNMEDYLGGIYKNPLARAVKCADRIHNLQTTLDSQKDFQQKYYDESLRWYVPFFKNTPFETDFNQALEALGQVL